MPKKFLGAFRISQRNVVTISKKKMFDGEIKEKRGGDWKTEKYENKRENVQPEKIKTSLPGP